LQPCIVISQPLFFQLFTLSQNKVVFGYVNNSGSLFRGITPSKGLILYLSNNLFTGNTGGMAVCTTDLEKAKIEKKVHNKKLEFSEFQDLKLEITNRNFKKD